MTLRSIFTACLIAAAAFAADADKYWEQRVSLFNQLPVTQNDIIFLGNSITDGGNFEELFSRDDVKNRGIRSDAIPGVMKRLDQVTNGKPRKIFLLIGINDVSHGLTVDKLAERYENLVKAIKEKSPDTKLYVQSIMPINNDFGVYKGLKGKENTVVEFNNRIRKIASDNSVTYIDLWPALSDGKGKLKRNYTNDGLHLTGEGYRAWTNHIRPYIDE
ncbi:MAG: sialate O-acetylesterase [Bacteroides sp.]|nr:sialate O-acetylesterase [Bacteroides sp.]